MVTQSQKVTSTKHQETRSSDLANRCECLQQSARFLCRLKEMKQKVTPWTDIISMMLRAAKTGLELWQSILICRLCWNDDDNSALSLMLISIELAVKCLWRNFVARQDQKSSSNGCSYSSDKSQAIPGMLVDVRASVNVGIEPTGKLYPEFTREEDQGFKVGDLQIFKEDQTFVLGTLIVRLLGRIRKMARESRIKIQTICDRGGNSAERPDYCLPSKTTTMMLDNFDDFVQESEQRLKCIIT
ncbi:hypothetical protein HIM_01201 [Hirsutella minnesotensis 3608]|nr:hypothetical protein HIM_01201 [Hirsutella minnesotensis 3608]